jgi:hypothetical protein
MFEEGQVWSYKNRVGEEKSTLLILYIENLDSNLKEDKVIHIAIDNIKIKNLKNNKKISDGIQHVPLSERALIKSVLKLEKHNVELPDFREDYNYWKKAFENGEGGVWSVEVAKIIDYTEETLNINVNDNHI